MKTELIDIAQVKANPNNPRVIKDDAFRKLVASIKEFPEMLEIRPIVVNADMIVLGGNMRLRACKEAGMKKIPIIKAEDLTEEQQRQFIIKDNVSGGEWDWEILANEWDPVELSEWGLDLPEMDVMQIEPEAQEDNYEIPDEIKTDIVPGDLFEIGDHRLLCGDSTDSDQVAKLMNGEKADMVFTDPPYGMSFKGQRLSNTTIDGKKVLNHKGINTKHEKIRNDSLDEKAFNDFIDQVLSNIYLFNSGAWYICFASLELNCLLNGITRSGQTWKSIIIWIKNQATLSNMDYKRRYEPIVYGQPGSKFYGERFKQEDIWEFQRTLKNDLHPTMKPIPLIENALKNSSREGMKVLDLFLGSGSTMVAAHQLGRKCYGMELDPTYCQVIIDRMIKLDPTLTIKRNGQPFTGIDK